MTFTIPATKFSRAITFIQNKQGGSVYVTEKRPSLTNPGTVYNHMCFVLVWCMPWHPASQTCVGPRRLVKYRASDA